MPYTRPGADVELTAVIGAGKRVVFELPFMVKREPAVRAFVAERVNLPFDLRPDNGLAVKRRPHDLTLGEIVGLDCYVRGTLPELFDEVVPYPLDLFVLFRQFCGKRPQLLIAHLRQLLPAGCFDNSSPNVTVPLPASPTRYRFSGLISAPGARTSPVRTSNLASCQRQVTTWPSSLPLSRG